jgi:hypothetical protein
LRNSFAYHYRPAAPEAEGEEVVTVKEAIKLLERMPDKEVAVLVDCPYCGKGSQLEKIDQCVLLESKREE